VRGALCLVVAVALLGCPATPGVTCRSHEDCHSMAEGYCARAEICTRVCDTTADCPEGSACASGGARRVCLRACERDSDCVTGFSCQADVDDVRVCRLTLPLEPPK